MSMMNTSSVPSDDNDINMVAFWLRRDPTRWTAGVFAGLFAGVVSLVFAMILSTLCGLELWFPAKLWATIVLGAPATEYGMNFVAIGIGFILHELFCVFWGVIYSHFVFTNSRGSLLAMGLVWGCFSWIFDWCLYAQAFKPIFAAQLSYGAVFFVCQVYGLSLSSVAFFDRMLRGDRRG